MRSRLPDDYPGRERCATSGASDVHDGRSSVENVDLIIRRPLILAPLALLAANPAPRAPRFERVFPLAPEEGVFAYARISPDGRYLAYASEVRLREGSREVTQTVTLVDLRDRGILFTEPGIDAYFSTDGERMIFLSFAGRRNSVTIRNNRTGALTRDIAPASLGDYFSWATHDTKNLILTIKGNYYYLDGDSALLPASAVPPCAGIGRAARPLISRDGRQITTFVRGTVVVRNRTDCNYVFDTGIRGAKADFSWDGRYIAFHAPKTSGRGYDIHVVDLQQRTVRTITSFSGSSYFPSWTRDGRLSFRYDGDDYRGFMMASDVLTAPARPLPATAQHVPARRRWWDIFPETPSPETALALVLVWAPWSAHSPIALADLQRARAYFERADVDVAVLTAADPASIRSDVTRMRAEHGIDLPEVPLAAARVAMTEAHNQIPTVLLFRGTELVDRRLGAQTFEELRDWVAAALPAGAASAVSGGE
jgi:hypothetical protein